MEKRLNFIKLAGKWFVHLPDYPGHYSELEMVLGADVMCDMIDKFDTGHITVTVSDKAFSTMFSTRDYILEFVKGDSPSQFKKDVMTLKEILDS
jgi:hypothetical protein